MNQYIFIHEITEETIEINASNVDQAKNILDGTVTDNHFRQLIEDEDYE